MENLDSVGATVVVVLDVLDVGVVNVVDGAMVVVAAVTDEVDDRVVSSPEQPIRITATSATVSGAIARLVCAGFVRSSLIHSIVADTPGCMRHNRTVSLQNEIAASHLETLIERLTGVHKATPDAEGDYSVHLRGATFMSRVDGDDTPVCRVYAIISDGVEKTTELLEALNAINTRLTYLRIIWVRNQILLEGNHLALTMDETEFTAICNDIANAANAFGDALVTDFGGTARFKESQDSDYLKVREGHGPIYL